MIATEFYTGQGFGNQLWCYITTRLIAKKHGHDFGIISQEKFLGKDFMNVDMGKPVQGITHEYIEKSIIHPLNGSDIRIRDEQLLNVADNTKIDGYMQDGAFVEDHKNEIREWLKIKPEYENREFSNENICVINFRGGGYSFDMDFFLPKRYWKNAIAHMRKMNPNFTFVVVTDDTKTAKKFFPDFAVHHWSVGGDYAVIKNAQYLILSNSSFALLPAWLSTDLKYAIAPKYLTRFNYSDGYWSLGYNLMKGFMYMDRGGNLSDYETCLKEFNDYIQAHPELYKHPTQFKRSPKQLWLSSVNAFRAIKKDTSIFYALGWVLHARGFRGAVWIKDRLTKTYRLTRKSVGKSVRKVRQALEDIRLEMRWARRERDAKKTWKTPEEIATYRKKINIYDCFNFFNELELLDIRLSMLYDHVDHFVIVESRMTHSGLPKPLYFEENKHLFERYTDKIIHYVIEHPLKDFDDAKKRVSDPHTPPLERSAIESGLASDYVGAGLTHFLRDFYEKESVKIALVNSGISDDDFCFVSDLDEIWNPDLLIDYSRDDIYKLRQIGYIYYLNMRTSQPDWRGWTGTIGTKFKNIRNSCLNDLRKYKKMEPRYTFLKNGGWHFSFQGGAERVRTKIKSYSHQELNKNELRGNVETLIKQKVDLRGNDEKMWIDESNVPAYLLEHKDKYRSMFK